MNVVPRNIMDLLQWGAQHADLWSLTPATIGLTALQAAAFKDAYNTARNKNSAQLTARDTWRGSINSQRDAMAEFRRIAGDTVQLIKAFADNAADPTVVYNLAQIPLPNINAPLPPPGQPTDFTANLDASGAVTLRWRCDNPGGQTVYIVRRKIAPQATFEFLNATGSREIIDTSIPAGAPVITYTITAQRGQIFGQPSLPFQIMFGSGGGGGGAFITHQQSLQHEGQQGMKMAA